MKKTDRKRFAEILGSTAELFNRTLTPAATELLWNVLVDLDLPEIEQAISRHLRDPERGKFMPTPADIRFFCGLRRPSASIAWGEVLDTMERHGAYSSVLFADGVTNAVIRDMGGWPVVCHKQATDENPAWVQKDFEHRYEEYRQAGRIHRMALLGMQDEHNLKHGFLEHVQKTAIYIETAQAVPVGMLVHRTSSLLEEGQTGKLKMIEGGKKE